MIGKYLLTAAAVALTGLTGSAQAQTFFNDMGSGNTSYGSADYLIAEAASRSIAMPEFQFTAGATGSLSEIDIALWGAGLPGGVNAVLMSSVANAPGQVLGTFALTDLPTGVGSSVARATGISGINLTAGTSYYLSAQATNGAFGTASYWWAANSTGATGRISDLAGTRQFNLGTGTIGAFSLVGAAAAVPEPASWAMVIVGVGLVGVAMRRRQKSASGRVAVA